MDKTDAPPGSAPSATLELPLPPAPHELRFGVMLPGRHEARCRIEFSTNEEIRVIARAILYTIDPAGHEVREEDVPLGEGADMSSRQGGQSHVFCNKSSSALMQVVFYAFIKKGDTWQRLMPQGPYVSTPNDEAKILCWTESGSMPNAVYLLAIRDKML